MKTITKILNYDDHIDSDKPNSISVTTLMGNMYKAQKYLDKAPKTHFGDLVLKRSSFIGTSCHNRMEMILKQDETEYDLEIFKERDIIVDGVTYTIAGSCDVLEKTEDGTWIIMDLKTGYFKSYSEEKQKKDALQMSLYRWLNQDDYDIDDRAWVLAISQSNNYIDEIPVELMSLEATQDYIENKLYAIAQNTKVDCNDGIKYSACAYCNYDCEERK